MKNIPQPVYEVLRWVVSVVLPAVATFLAALDAAWHWNWPMEAILATFTAVETILGALFLGSKYGHDAAEHKAGENGKEDHA